MAALTKGKLQNKDVFFVPGPTGVRKDERWPLQTIIAIHLGSTYVRPTPASLVAKQL